ncbi:hypothetical protein DI392_15925 [Vibrio albus]|uniref:Uncharacterized protein n=1 Tax=Vibrio albus TaxID=2200953 RepID=A0A2U3B5U0_9VIBR|nr:hypothetical protein [Vibrio albus]PWI32168.1 hypothetical protein DI392_15925 [Vibrio albus]
MHVIHISKFNLCQANVRLSSNQKPVLVLKYDEASLCFAWTAVVAGNNPELDTTVVVDMGQKHRNQWFVDAMGYHGERLKTDKDGLLTVNVKGSETVDVDGYLGVWVPDVK